MSTPSKPAKRGRKPKSPSEKPAQLTIRLDPKVLFGLDLVARDRRTSLSQAAEYLLEQQIRSYAVEGEPATGLLEAAATMVKDNLRRGNPLAAEEPVDAEEVASILLSSQAGRAFFMPVSLQTPSERYFRNFYRDLLKHAQSELGDSEDPVRLTCLMLVLSMLGRPDLFQHLHATAKGDEQEGLSTGDAARAMYEALKKEAAKH